jgi:RimJ/RimL family protein N-acetyltransferase
VNGPILRTARLRLRPLTPFDAPALATALNDLEISRWLRPVPYPYTLDDALRFAAHAAEGEEIVWVIDDGTLAGIIGMDTEFGYWLARDRWGRGVATEAGRAVLRWHFTDGDGHDLTSGHFDGNDRSGNVLRKLGFRQTGRARMDCLATGTTVDSHRMALSAADFRAALAQAG